MNFAKPILLSGVFLVLAGCASRTTLTSQTMQYGGKIYRFESAETLLDGTEISYTRKFLFCGPDGRWTLATSKSKEAEKFEKTVRNSGKRISSLETTFEGDEVYSREGRLCRDVSKAKKPKAVATGADTAPIVPSGDSFEGGD